MATRRKSKALASAIGGRAMSKSQWLDKMKSAINTKHDMLRDVGGAGKFIVIKNHRFHLNGVELEHPVPAVILDSVREKQWYETDYDKDTTSAPDCYAVGTDPDEMRPDPSAPKPQAERCKDCWANAFGSGKRKNSKACADKIRLALLPAVEADADKLAKEEPHFLRIPTMSMKNYKNFVDMVETQLGRPEFGVVCELDVKLHPDYQHVVTFKGLDEIDDPVIGGVILDKRDRAAQDGLRSFPEVIVEEEEEEGRSKKIDSGRRAARRSVTAAPPKSDRRTATSKPVAGRRSAKRSKF